MGRKRVLTAEQERDIWNFYQEGQKVSWIAKQLFIPYMLVYNSIKRELDYDKIMRNPIVNDNPQTDAESESEEQA